MEKLWRNFRRAGACIITVILFMALSQKAMAVENLSNSLLADKLVLNLDEKETTKTLTLNKESGYKDVTWSCSNSQVVSMKESEDENSIEVKALKRGIAVIEAKVDNQVYSCVVAVVNNEVDPDLYYFVNAGDINPSTRNQDYFGICNSVTEQFYGEDPVTGMKWGVLDEETPNSRYPELSTGTWTWPCENNGYDDNTDSSVTYRYTKDQPPVSSGGIGIPYQFELPEGKYSVLVNMASGWSSQINYEYDITINEGKSTEQKKHVKASINPDNPATVEFEAVVLADRKLLLNIDKAAGSGCAVVNQIYIRKYDKSPRFEKSMVSMALGETYQMKAVNLNGSSLSNFKSTAPEVVTVNNNGVVTALKEGSATITAMAGTKLLTAKVIVKRDVEIVIDYANTIGPINHIGGGNLHLFDHRSPAGWLSDGISVNAVRGQDYSKLTNPYYEYLPGFFEDATYTRLKNMNPDVKLMIGLYYGYKNKTGSNWKKGAATAEYMEKWQNHIKSVLADAKEKNIEVYSWIPMNEPDLQWNSDDWNNQRPQKFYEVAYQTVKEVDPEANVQGPEIAGLFSLSKMKNFLLYCKEHDCLPDVLSWHDLKRTTPVLENDIKSLNTWMENNGITPMPITITEYQGTGYRTDDAGRKQQGNYNTGLTTAYLASMERSENLGLIAGLRSEWGLPGSNSNARGDMGEMCDFDTKQMATGLWYVYNAYWDMTGNKVETNHDKTKIEVLATVNTSNTSLQSGILIGNWEETDKSPFVQLKNIPSCLVRDGKVHVRMEGLNETLATPCYGTTKMVDKDFVVGEDNNLVLYPKMTGRQTCFIVLTPPTENGQVLKATACKADITGQMKRSEKELDGEPYVSFTGGETSSYKDADGNETYIENGDTVTYSLTASESGIYNFTSTAVTGIDAGFMQLYVDGEQFGFPEDLYSLKADKLVFNHGNLYLSKGEHEFRFRIVGHGKQLGSSAMTLNFMEFGLNRVVTP